MATRKPARRAPTRAKARPRPAAKKRTAPKKAARRAPARAKSSARAAAAAHQAGHERPQRHFVGRDARAGERPRDADAHRTVEVEVDPLLDGGAFMRQRVRRLHPARPS